MIRFNYLKVPDKYGNPVDIAQSFERAPEYGQLARPYTDARIGPDGSRTAEKKYILNGINFRLIANNGPVSTYVTTFGFQSKKPKVN